MIKKYIGTIVMCILTCTLLMALAGCGSGTEKSSVEITPKDGAVEKTTISDLKKTFESNEVSAAEKYKGASVVVYGYVTEINGEQIVNGMKVGPNVTITEQPNGSIFTSFNVELSSTDAVSSLKKGDCVKATGTFFQKTGNFELRLDEYKGAKRVVGGPSSIEVVKVGS